MKKGKGIVLYSGGLDSLLTAKILLDQGIEIIGFHCILPFIAPDQDPAELRSSILAEQIGLNLEHYRCGSEYLDMVQDPPHGYGKEMNPCIDCKLFFIMKAAEYMKQINADFIATGEVVGQRPMSQLKHMLNHIEKKSGIKGRLVRPLSAKILKPTIPEIEGIIDREKLYGISGRSRSVQMEMAKKFGIREYSSPAGGCLFTDPNIAKRVKDIYEYHDNYLPLDFYLMTFARHFRISKGAKLIVCRNDVENNQLEKYIDQLDYFFIPDFKGPLACAKGELTDTEIKLACSIIMRYGKPSPEGKITIMMNGEKLKTISADRLEDEEILDELRI